MPHGQPRLRSAYFRWTAVLPSPPSAVPARAPQPCDAGTVSLGGACKQKGHHLTIRYFLAGFFRGACGGFG